MTDLTWENTSRGGFRGGRYESAPVVVFDEAGEHTTLQFLIQEYTSDEQDYFGVATSKWFIEVEISDKQRIGELVEYETNTTWGLGNDYARADFAKEFAMFVVDSYIKYQTLAVMPVAILDGYR